MNCKSRVFFSFFFIQSSMIFFFFFVDVTLAGQDGTGQKRGSCASVAILHLRVHWTDDIHITIKVKEFLLQLPIKLQLFTIFPKSNPKITFESCLSTLLHPNRVCIKASFNSTASAEPSSNTLRLLHFFCRWACK